MKRRSFLGVSGTAALYPVVNSWGVTTGISVTGSDINNNKMEQIKNIAGYSLQELLGQYKGYLFDDFLPFMDKHVIDHELGGFICNTDRSGRNITTNKQAWFDGRGIWIYSFLYNNLKKEQMYLEVAQKTTDFVLKIRPDKRKLWPASYTREGKDVDNTCYGDFALY